LSKPHKIFGGPFEQGALDQFASAMEQDFVVRGALMPDAHQGYSLPIGAVVATEGYVVPSWVGYDIGCGMCAVPTTFVPGFVMENAKQIWGSIMRSVPVGFHHNKEPLHPEWRSTPLLTPAGSRIFDEKGGFKQLGTLGGGNHFIEVGADENDIVWIIIHSGSRGIGHGLATHYMKLASPNGKATEGHFGFRTDSELGHEYMIDQEFALQFALENRMAIMRRVVNAIQDHTGGCALMRGSLINRNHNHAEQQVALDWIIHRKGATHANRGMDGVVPGNMRDGSFIVRGLGNADSLWSSSHGAGRVLSRKAARNTLHLEEFQAEMEGIVAQVTHGTLDESPMAYKDIFEVMKAQSELVETVGYVRPILNVKG
jgi:tRNA-splicing ligase RtcB